MHFAAVHATYKSSLVWHFIKPLAAAVNMNPLTMFQCICVGVYKCIFVNVCVCVCTCNVAVHFFAHFLLMTISIAILRPLSCISIVSDVFYFIWFSITFN